ncbi:MAG: MFS transporter, partial [Thermoanaerobaculia bacterium]
AATAPAIFLMLPGGVLADQLDRRRVIAISQWAQAGSALWLAIAIATHHIGVGQIIGAALVVGIAQSFSAPAYQAMILDLLDESAWSRASRSATRSFRRARPTPCAAGS